MINVAMQMVLACLVYNCPSCLLAADAMSAINDGVELYSMQLFEDSPSSVVSRRCIVHMRYRK